MSDRVQHCATGRRPRRHRHRAGGVRSPIGATHLRAPFCLLIGFAVTAGGCAQYGTAVGAGASAGIVVAQERPVGEAISDTSLKVALNGKLLDAGFNDLFRRVGVDVVEGRVMLTGHVRSDELRDQAAALAWGLSGVRQVINEIRVSETKDAIDFARDGLITARLRGRILSDSRIADINYTITTDDGVVYLIGIARSQDELDRVLGHARNIAHVRKVVNHVLLANDPRRRR